MSVVNLIGVVAALVLGAFLAMALLFPERF
ncbi:potassium-transporting ATPase subunit F [Salininema proteolyticum]|uniref:Potassium-transporting ATPase subunit F n=1 Tax=Salininema proteolyticum TaxID=1607685 RepID=A0ABV8TY64_9ACTN